MAIRLPLTQIQDWYLQLKQQRVLDSRGFSLLELLLVLMIVFVVCSSALYMNNRYLEKRTFELFYNQLLLDVRHIQTVAIQEGRYLNLSFNKSGNQYEGRKSVFEPIFKRQLTPGYNLSSFSNLQELAFQPNGNIEMFGSLTFNTPAGIRTVRVFIGKGRMTLEK